METLKKLVIFQETELSYISGNEAFLPFSYVLGGNFPRSKSKKNPLLKSFLYFRKDLTKPPNKQKICSEEGSCLL